MLPSGKVDERFVLKLCKDIIDRIGNAKDGIIDVSDYINDISDLEAIVEFNDYYKKRTAEIKEIEILECMKLKGMGVKTIHDEEIDRRMKYVIDLESTKD